MYWMPVTNLHSVDKFFLKYNVWHLNYDAVQKDCSGKLEYLEFVYVWNMVKCWKVRFLCITICKAMVNVAAWLRHRTNYCAFLLERHEPHGVSSPCGHRCMVCATVCLTIMPFLCSMLFQTSCWMWTCFCSAIKITRDQVKLRLRWLNILCNGSGIVLLVQCSIGKENWIAPTLGHSNGAEEKNKYWGAALWAKL